MVKHKFLTEGFEVKVKEAGFEWSQESGNDLYIFHSKTHSGYSVWVTVLDDGRFEVNTVNVSKLRVAEKYGYSESNAFANYYFKASIRGVLSYMRKYL